MTVAELIEKLQEMPQDAVVWADTPGWGDERVEMVEHSSSSPVVIYLEHA